LLIRKNYNITLLNNKRAGCGIIATLSQQLAVSLGKSGKPWHSVRIAGIFQDS